MNSVVWTKYWQENHINSFGDVQKNYSGSIRECWLEFFKEMESSADVLDLCCGNASLASLFKEYDLTHYNNCKITGVDYALLSISDDIMKDTNTSFQMNVNVENLPFESDSFDYIISNFGLEYSNMDLSIPDMLRVLKPLGLIQLVSHIENSELILSSIKIKDMLDEFFSGGNVFATFQSLTKLLVVENFNEAEEFRILLNEQLNRFVKEYGDTFIQFDFINFLKYILRNINKDTDKVINEYESEMKLYHKRLNSMVNASLRQEDFFVKLSKNKVKLLKSELITDEKNNLLALKVLLTKEY